MINLPQPVLKLRTDTPKFAHSVNEIILGETKKGTNILWNPLELPNPHLVVIGTSGAGKTQTVKAIASQMNSLYNCRVIIVDFHGDQELPGEKVYQFDQKSDCGINPLKIDLCDRSGGPSLQAISVAATLRRSLTMGPNQEGLLIDCIKSLYEAAGITADTSTWNRVAPTFADLQQELNLRSESGCKESDKLLLKMAATFQYGIFSRPQPNLDSNLIRLDFSALSRAPGLGAIACEAIVKQLMDFHRMMPGTPGTLKTYLFIDEAREVKNSPSVLNVVRDGRKYGLGLGLASQMPEDFSKDVLANTATKIVMMSDSSQTKRVATAFRLGEGAIAELKPLEAIVRLGTVVEKIRVIPYYQREAV